MGHPRLEADTGAEGHFFENQSQDLPLKERLPLPRLVVGFNLSGKLHNTAELGIRDVGKINKMADFLLSHQINLSEAGFREYPEPRRPVPKVCSTPEADE